MSLLGKSLASTFGFSSTPAKQPIPSNANSNNNTHGHGHNERNSISVQNKNSVRAQAKSLRKTGRANGEEELKSRSINAKAIQQQRLKNFIEFFTLYCRSKDGKIQLSDVQEIFKDPLKADNSNPQASILMEEFNTLLKAASITHSDWFDHVTIKKSENRDVIIYEEFFAEIQRFCIDLQHSPMHEEKILSLFRYISNQREDNCFDRDDLDFVFNKLNLSLQQVRKMKLIASQIKVVGIFLDKTNYSIKEHHIVDKDHDQNIILITKLESILGPLLDALDNYIATHGPIEIPKVVKAQPDEPVAPPLSAEQLINSQLSTTSTEMDPAVDIDNTNFQNNQIVIPNVQNTDPTTLPSNSQISISSVASATGIMNYIVDKLSGKHRFQRGSIVPIVEENMSLKDEPGELSREASYQTKRKVEIHHGFLEHLDYDERVQFQKFIRNMEQGDENSRTQDDNQASRRPSAMGTLIKNISSSIRNSILNPFRVSGSQKIGSDSSKKIILDRTDEDFDISQRYLFEKQEETPVDETLDNQSQNMGNNKLKRNQSKGHFQEILDNADRRVVNAKTNMSKIR